MKRAVLPMLPIFDCDYDVLHEPEGCSNMQGPKSTSEVGLGETPETCVEEVFRTSLPSWPK